jgi:hypothetical protein
MKTQQTAQPCHTPGPWTANADTVWRGGNPIVCHPINDPRSIADAALIASAPALAAENAALREALAKAATAMSAMLAASAMHPLAVRDRLDAREAEDLADTALCDARAILAGKGAA